LDVEGEVLPAGGHDLVVEQGVAVDGGQVRGHQVVAVERGENADHHNAGVHFGGFPVGVCEGGAQFFREPVENPAVDPVGGDVHFQVEHGEFCLEVTAGDPFEDLRIQHSRHAVGTREVQFDLDPHEVLGAVEPLLRQQPLQAGQTPAQLVAVELAIGQVELTRHDLFPHRTSLLGWAAGRGPAAGVPVHSGGCPADAI